MLAQRTAFLAPQLFLAAGVVQSYCMIALAEG